MIRNLGALSGKGCGPSWQSRAFAAGFLLAVLGLAGGTTGATPMGRHLVFAHEVRTFQPCGDHRTLWVDVQGPMRQRLENGYRGVTTGVYESVYVELEGKLLDRSPGTFAADYDGTVRVTELLSIASASADDCHFDNRLGAQKYAVARETETYVFVCDQQKAYTVRTTGAEAWVFGPEGTLRLPAVAAEHGETYRSHAFELTIEGQQARLRAKGGVAQSCRNDRRRAV